MEKYDHKKIEKKWQEKWAADKLYEARENTSQKKYYPLVEFPYPSGDGLHVGHIRPYVAFDAIARKRRAEGFNVLFPFGWDAFGLPTENYAIKTGIHPKEVTKQNTDNFRRQVQALGVSFDWSREVNTTEPRYYKWTQWIFLQLWKHGLAYKKKMPINWCIDCKTGLANEEVVDEVCERCGGPVETREKEQWMLAITKYADRLHDDLDTVDYLEQIKIQQRNWIGRSEGAEIEFRIKNLEYSIKVFTTRPDTLFGATYMVLAPEHPLVEQIMSSVENRKEVEGYVAEAKTKKNTERAAMDKEKTGVPLKGIRAINPANNEEIPVWVADYVLGSVGTAAIMAVPAHDERDFAFAKKYGLPVRQVITAQVFDEKNPPQGGKEDTERVVAHSILRNPKDNTVLIGFLKDGSWGDRKPINFIIGGVEDGETFEEAGRREIREETGHTNVRFVGEVPLETEARFFQAQKDVNRHVHVHTLLFDLMSDERETVLAEEEDKHEFRWIPSSEVAGYINIPDDQLTWRYIESGGFAYEGRGTLTNSGEWSGLPNEEAKKQIVEYVGGTPTTTYKLRDWIFSRQRYWGEPIPMVNCKKCGWVPVPESELPIELPNVEKYQPTNTGESPLAAVREWVETSCPQCGEPAERETDTMPNWAGSSWYYLRYTDPGNDDALAGKEKLKYWTSVDWYNGGMEHTTLHLLYSRFWHKFLYDIGVVPTSEPYAKRTSHGLILAESGEKMSKSKGNVVNPDTVVLRFGADTMRVYEMFMGPFDEPISWSTDNIVGSRRFLEKVWRLASKVGKAELTAEEDALLHTTIKKASNDIETLKFNTAISALMILTNTLDARAVVPQDAYEILLRLLSPFAPHITEELWNTIGHTASIHAEPWPKYTEAKTHTETRRIAVSVNGRVRTELSITGDESEETLKERALSLQQVVTWTKGKQVKNVIYVPNRLINIVV